MVYKTIFLIIGLANLLGIALITLSNETTQKSLNTKICKTENIKTNYLPADFKKVS
ncbi:hypothetical protein RBU49_09145 [Clostridium sp. MB40-C1]|uniref:hypothetical protein n=1 Tax=Clostridium sp. MB40-C1 TaxID=3070996 RepID=UPI0027E1ED26|nr:hypothetical protein [Clostridium sp. MB40-C1]WMJ79065.1 hypothetical protein RBU49_09145 [Clostridium sp. MB40-C1]